MPTIIVNSNKTLDKALIQRAVEILQSGGLVGLPTETVYGLACDASNETALKALYDLKGRPGNHPVIVHLASINQLDNWALDISPVALTLAKQFWPGPMTLIFKKHPSVLDAVTGGQDTVGIRIPSHPIALALLEAFQGGIAAPSANKFGKISPTTAAHVQADLGDEIPMILNGGSCVVGVESTIIDCTNPQSFRILRPGQITLPMIQAVIEKAGLTIPVEDFQPKSLSNLEPKIQPAPETIRVSGSLESHYAPNAALFLLNAQEIQLHLDKRQGIGADTLGVMAFSKAPVGFSGRWVQMSEVAEDYAQRLYQVMRDLDDYGVATILVEQPPESDEWSAINDRLRRASVPKISR